MQLEGLYRSHSCAEQEGGGGGAAREPSLGVFLLGRSPLPIQVVFCF